MADDLEKRAAEGGHWRDMNSHWTHVGRPLRPGPDDVALFERFAAAAAGTTGARFDALLLGVTPEIAGCGWPPQTRLTAVDFSLSMIDSLWPAPGAPANSQVVCGNWLTTPIASQSMDFVIGDGCHAALAFPHEANAMAREVARVLRPGGTFVMRSFIRPDPGEGIAEVARDLAAGRIGSVHVLKWRLLAALCSDSPSGAALGDVWKAWDSMRESAARYGGRTGWSAAEIGTIEVYRGDVTTRFDFPTIAGLRALLARHFSAPECFYGGYELADRCPVMVMTRPES